MKTNLALLLFLCCVGIAGVTGFKNPEPLANTRPSAEMQSLDTSNGLTTGVRYVYIQFSDDTTKIVQLGELSDVINDRVVNYNMTSGAGSN